MFNFGYGYHGAKLPDNGLQKQSNGAPLDKMMLGQLFLVVSVCLNRTTGTLPKNCLKLA